MSRMVVLLCVAGSESEDGHLHEWNMWIEDIRAGKTFDEIVV